MRLLINLCGHDGVVSHYAGVGTIVKRYIYTFDYLLNNKDIDYHINLFTPEYNDNSFGFSHHTKKTHQSMKNVSIYELSNGTNASLGYGTPDNWKILSNNTAQIINKINFANYDMVLTIANDTPFAGLLKMIKDANNHKKIWIPHSTGRIHKVDSSIENSDLILNDRIKWEEEAIKYINMTSNCYLGATGHYIANHLVSEYGLDSNKILSITNGEILSKPTEYEETDECIRLFEKVKKYDHIILSFARAEKYKNLEATMLLGKAMEIKPVVIAQGYFKGQPIIKDYENLAKETDTLLFVDAPFNFPQYIIKHFNKEMILLVPSQKEIMGLTVNEIRKMNRNNVLIVANNIDGIKEQVNDEYDGILVDLDDIESSKNKVLNNFNLKTIKKLNEHAQNTLINDYNFEVNCNDFLKELLGECYE